MMMITRTLSLFLFLSVTCLNAQFTLVLQPDAANGKYAEVYSVVPNAPLFPTDLIRANAWTFQRVFGIERGLLDFDLSSIPQGAVITKATLSLYAPEQGHSQFHSGDNPSFLSRITSPWDEQSVTWNTQPSFTTKNQVVVPQSVNPYQDYLLIPVTQLVQDMVNDPEASHGFMLRLQRERIYRRMSFCSSDYADPKKHPRLVIEYLPSPCAFEVIQPGAAGKDAEIFSLKPQQTLNGENLRGNAWTFQGAFGIERGLLEFDLSHIPPNAQVHAAHLSLYALDEPNSQFHSGSNAATIRRITSPWIETKVNWSNQPSTTDEGKVHLSQSTSAFQDYTFIPVTNMVKEMIADPDHNFGFMLQLNTESLYRRLSFASGDSPNPANHPKLEICYTVPDRLALEEKKEELKFRIFPNPANDVLIYQHQDDPSRVLRMQIFDPYGRLVLDQWTNQFDPISIASLPDQFYWIRITGESGEILQTTSFIKQACQ